MHRPDFDGSKHRTLAQDETRFQVVWALCLVVLVIVAFWLCAMAGAQTPTQFPKVVAVQVRLTEAQRNATPGNEWMKPCGPDNHEDACYTPTPA